MSETPQNDAGDVADEGVEALYASLETSEISGLIDADLATDILWVYQNFADPNVTAAAAPNLGAWALLRWAKKASNRFFELLLPKALAVKAERDEKQEEETRTSAPQLAEIERMLNEIQNDVDDEHAKEGRVVVCPACKKPILLGQPSFKPHTKKLEHPEPCVYPADHPNYQQPAR